MMYPYGFHPLPAVLAAVGAPLGLGFVLRAGPRRVLVAVAGLSLFWLAFTLTVGAPSSYWGQQFTGLTVVGCAALAARLVGRGDVPLSGDRREVGP